MIRRLLVLGALAGVLVGGVLRLLGNAGPADAVWAASTAVMLVPLTWSVACTLWRRGSTWPARSSPSCSPAAMRSRSTRVGGRGAS